MGAPFPSASRELPRAGIGRAGAILTRTHPEFIVSKFKLKQAEGLSLIRQKRESGTQRLAFSSRPFVLCGLPVRRPPASQLIYQRRNGHFVLQLTGHPDFGLPYGQDRLIPIFLATLAVQQKSLVVRFRSAAEMLDTFGLAKGGKEYRRLVAAFERIFGATIPGGIGVRIVRFPLRWPPVSVHPQRALSHLKSLWIVTPGPDNHGDRGNRHSKVTTDRSTV